MPFHSKSDFCDKCGIKPRELSTYVSRKNVILSGEFIDDSLPQNQKFIEKRKLILEKKSKKTNPTKKKSVKVEDDIPIKEKSLPKEITRPPKISGPESDSLDWELDQKRLRLQNIKIETETSLLTLKAQKQRGEVIPTDLVKSLFAQHFKSISTAFHHATDNLLVKIAAKKGLTRAEVADFRGEIILMVNEAIKHGANESRKNIQNIINEYSSTKGVGERE